MERLFLVKKKKIENSITEIFKIFEISIEKMPRDNIKMGGTLKEGAVCIR